MSKVISYRDLARQHHLNFLKHQRREYQEREDYLARARRLLFKIEAQMRQSEILQYDLIRELARHFRMPVEFPGAGDRLATQQLFAENPFLTALSQFLANNLTPEEFLQRLEELKGKSSPPPESE